MRKEKKYPFAGPCLLVLPDRSVFVDPDGSEEVFREGRPSAEAEDRLKQIRREMKGGFLIKLIDECHKPDADLGELKAEHKAVLQMLVDSVTSQVGRALVGLSILQLAIKAISHDQSIRLHKGGRGEFSWVDGIPMRVLDKLYVTPVLRGNGLLSLNADGFMMTRSLAENYPYTRLYKAAIRGARESWLSIVDLVEKKQMEPRIALKNLIALLLNKSEQFKKMASEAFETVESFIKGKPPADRVIGFVRSFVDQSSYSARVFEIALHSVFQVLEDNDVLQGTLKPLCQMRSANKKHGNIGDVEVTEGPETLEILEAWDAKYGKTYLRDELDELGEKLAGHPETKVVGFVVDQKPNLKKEIVERISELEQLHGVQLTIESFDIWVRHQLDRSGLDRDVAARKWLSAFAKSMCQMSRDRAPIDEPADVWVNELRNLAGLEVKKGFR